ncbi:MAG: hypothetical protein V3573_01710 [Desulfovibrionaceae bacterium]
MFNGLDLHSLLQGLFLPLVRLTFFISLGLLVGNFIESLNWTRAVARVAEPLIRLARLKDISGASFSLAFFSGVAANTMLAEAYEQGNLTRRELIFSNLFNSLPTYFLHLPTVFFITAPFIAEAAFFYVGLTALAALLRTAFIVFLGRMMLPPLPDGCVVCLLKDEEPQSGRFRTALQKTWQRFKKRLPKIMYITTPIYAGFFLLKHFGAIDWLERSMADNVGLLAWLDPQALGIVAFHMVGEFTAGLAAAGVLIQDGSLSPQQIVLALLAGNVLSTPMRAMRHQFPYYAGIFPAGLALRLIVYNQALRITSVILVGAAYALLA